MFISENGYELTYNQKCSPYAFTIVHMYITYISLKFHLAWTGRQITGSHQMRFIINLAIYNHAINYVS